jgi:LysM domain
MKLRLIFFIGILVTALVLLGLSLPVQAAPVGQGISFTTNTPAANGNIYYIVQANDNCTRIAHLYNITVEQIIGFNSNLNANCDLIAGEKLFVGTGGPSSISPTPGPSPTPLPPTITPTPFAGTTQICVLLFNDMNGDALHEANESVIPGGAISVTETNGKYSKTLPTAINSDPTAYPGTCFNDIPEGHYNIAVAIPDNYNPTVNLTYTLDLKAGDSDFVDFGAQSRDTTITQPQTNPGGGGTSPVLGIVGGFLLLGGLGLGWYALRLRRPQSKLQQSGLLKR